MSGEVFTSRCTTQQGACVPTHTRAHRYTRYSTFTSGYSAIKTTRCFFDKACSWQFDVAMTSAERTPPNIHPTSPKNEPMFGFGLRLRLQIRFRSCSLERWVIHVNSHISVTFNPLWQNSTCFSNIAPTTARTLPIKLTLRAIALVAYPTINPHTGNTQDS